MYSLQLFITLESLSITTLLIISASLVVLAAAFILIYLFFFKRHRYKKAVEELAGKYQNLHSTLIGSDYQLIKRLETISGTNILYANVLPTWRKAFDIIQGSIDADCIRKINDAKDFLAEKKWKELKEILPEVSESVKKFENELKKLDDGLRGVFQPETDANEKIRLIKNDFRTMKSDFYSRQKELSLVNETFTNLFNKIDNKLQNVDIEIANGHYDTALNILGDEIEPPIKEMASDLLILSSICVLIQTTIPQKLEQLRNKYDSMISSNFILSKIMKSDDFLFLENKLNVLMNKAKVLELDGVEEELKSLVVIIDNLMLNFQAEEKAKEEFLSKKEEVFKAENELQKEQINLYHNLPDLKKIYLFTSDDQSLIAEVTTNVSRCTRSKREVDASTHSTSLQPYSDVIKKLNELSAEIEKAEESMDKLKKHILLFKKMVEDAHNAINKYYVKVREYETKSRLISNEKIVRGFAESFDDIYQCIDQLHSKTIVSPIDVRACEELTNKLVAEADETFALIDRLLEIKQETEENILMVNRYRNQSATVKSFIEQAENFYNEGQFEEALNASRGAIEQSKNHDLF